MDQGEDVEGAARKRDPLDFALWKGHKEAEDTSWESPWGPGRPGWHIECSAMAEKLLGVGFEIHGGGSDLIFPHHENEAAQTRAARDADLTRLWVHVGMVRLDSEKMSKSIGNVFMLRRGAGAPRARDAAHVLRRRPLPPADGVRRGPPRGGARPRRRHPQHRARRSSTGPARRGRRRSRSASSTPSPTTSTPPRPWRPWPSGGGRPTAATAAPSAATTCARCSTSWAWPASWSRARSRSPTRWRRCGMPASRRARAARLGRGRPVARRAARLGWEVRDGPDGPELMPPLTTSASSAGSGRPAPRARPRKRLCITPHFA